MVKRFSTKETSQLSRFTRKFHKTLRKKENHCTQILQKKKIERGIHVNSLCCKHVFGIKTDITTKENKDMTFFMSTDCEKFLKSTL